MNYDSGGTVNGRPRLPSALGFSFYAGDLRLYRERNIHTGQGEVMHLRDVPPWHVPAGARFDGVLQTEFAYWPHEECQGHWARICIDEGGHTLWRGTTKPDGFIAPRGVQGDWFSVVTGETVCGVHAVSGMQRIITHGEIGQGLHSCKVRKRRSQKVKGLDASQSVFE